MPLQNATYNTDWVFSTTSDVCVAKHREWFLNYTPFESHTKHIALHSSMPVVGVGDVRIEVNTSSSLRGTQTYTSLLLRNVLHCPRSICNIVGLWAMDGDYDVELRGPENSWLRNKQSRVVVLLDLVVLWKLWLVGQPKGQSSLEKGGLYYINACWPKAEREKVKLHLQQTAKKVKATGDSADSGAASSTHKGEESSSSGQKRGEGAGYTAAEKGWLKQQCAGEFRFLLQLGLNIHSEKDREEGRGLVRALMKKDS